MFRRSLTHESLVSYLSRQLSTAFPDDAPLRLDDVVRAAAERAHRCFAGIRHPAFSDGDDVYFDHLHGDQYTTFIYYASNCAYTGGDEALAKKLFLLNKAQSGFFCLYDTLLPPVVFLNHAIGTVIGRGTYGNYLCVTQNVTFGKDRDVTPTLGEGVVVYGGSVIAGASAIGDDVSIAPQTVIVNQSIPARSVVSGRPPDLVVKPRKRDLTGELFRRG